MIIQVCNDTVTFDKLPDQSICSLLFLYAMPLADSFLYKWLGDNRARRLSDFSTSVTAGHRARRFDYSALPGYEIPLIDFILFRIQDITVQQ